MDADHVKAYYNQPGVVTDYAQAVSRIGLWRSEEKIFKRLFKPEQTLLELGCGTGRIAFGLWELGYKHLLGVDLARDMVEEARRINKVLEYGVSFRVGDATKLSYGDGEFDGAIFGFNGLMTIPPYSEEPEDSRKYFVALRNLRDELQREFQVSLGTLSMGMSNDYPIAIEEGATIVRVGTAIFGTRSARALKSSGSGTDVGSDS